MALSALALLLIAAPAFSEQPVPVPAPQEFVDPATLQARVETLRDAVADPRVSDITVKSRAHDLFGDFSEKPLAVPAGHYRRMDREAVTGKLGSIEGMQEAADKRLAEWKRTHMEPPPPDLVSSLDQARVLQGSKRLNYDSEGKLADNQMGLFQYMRDRLDGGLVKLNERMKIIGALVGDAFTYATVAHESQHAIDREAGRLTPEQEIAGEVSAFRTQYLWIKLMDENGERLLTLHGRLKIWMLHEPDVKIKAALNEAVVYLEHLSDVVATNGDKDELEKLVKRLGYTDDHHHDHGDDEHKSRGASLPPSA